MKHSISAVIILSSLTLFGCGSSSSSSDDTNSNDSVEALDSDENLASESSENVDTGVSDAGELVGVWERCRSDITATVWQFESNGNFRTYISPEGCPDFNTYTIEDSTQGGTYEILTTSTSEEGLPVNEMRFVITDVFGGFQMPAPDLHILIHVDGDNMYFGFGGRTQGEASRDLILDDQPYIRQ